MKQFPSALAGALAGGLVAAVVAFSTTNISPVSTTSDVPQVSQLINQALVPAVNTALNTLAGPGVTIATLPTCGTANTGAVNWVTNGVTAPVIGATPGTTGAVHAMVMCDGTNWTYQ
jgi:hypothetical protein